MLKFTFSLKTRDGQPVEHIVIAAHDREDAERKLRQMYQYCEILQCTVRQSAESTDLATAK